MSSLVIAELGDSTNNHIEHPAFPSGKVQLLPTDTYFAYQTDENVVECGPQEVVVAREFEYGRVLFRTDLYGKNPDFYSTPKLNIPLKKPMRPVDTNSNIGDYVKEVTLSGYQGLLLLY